mgnify:CR=1 FL=1
MEILRDEKRIKNAKKGLFQRNYEFIKEALYLGYGINLRNPRIGKKPRIVDIYKSPSMRSTHLICLGRTRWGKTRFIERAIVDDIESGFSIFHLDPKQDFDNLEAILDAVIRTQRYDDFMLFTPFYDKISLKINVFYDQTPDAISDIIKAMSPKGKEAFFNEIAGELGKAVSIGEYLKGKKEIRFVDIFKYTSVEEINKLYSEIENAEEEGYVEIAGKKYERRQLKVDALLSLNKIRQKDKTYWSKVNTTIELVLSQLSTGDAGSSFGKASGNPLLYRMSVGKPFIFTAIFGSLFIGKDPAYRMSRMINAMHEKLYGRIYVKFQKLYPPVSEFWDEGSVVIYEGAFEKINKVGGAGGYIHIFTQSFSDFDLNVGREGAKVFFDNADVMLLSVLDQETAQYFSKASGEIVRSKPMWTREEGIIGVPEKEPLIPADLFMKMPKGAFHAFIEGSWYRGYSPMLMDRKRIIIEPLPYPDYRIVRHFAEKYKLSENEASQIVKQEEVYYDYDWIMKEGLADLWIDLTEFPYYKNYVANTNIDNKLILNEIRSSKGDEDLIEISEKFVDAVKPYVNNYAGNMLQAYVENDILYVQYYLFTSIFGIKPKNQWIRTSNGYTYVMVKIPHNVKDKLNVNGNVEAVSHYKHNNNNN